MSERLWGVAPGGQRELGTWRDEVGRGDGRMDRQWMEGEVVMQATRSACLDISGYQKLSMDNFGADRLGVTIGRCDLSR